MNLSLEKALELTLDWNKVDLAEHEVLKDVSNLFKNQDLENIMIKAIKIDNVNFVQLLIKKGFQTDVIFQNDLLFREQDGFYSDYEYQV